MTRKKRQGHELQMSGQQIPDVLDDTQSDIITQITLAKIKQSPDREDSDYRRRKVVEHVHILLDEYIIHHPLDQKGHRPFCRAIAHHTHHRQHEVGPDVGPQILQQSAVILQRNLLEPDVRSLTQHRHGDIGHSIGRPRGA